MSTLLREIAVAAGSQKLIAGQVADLEAEGKKVKRRELQFIHQNKTAAILQKFSPAWCDECQRGCWKACRDDTIRAAPGSGFPSHRRHSGRNTDLGSTSAKVPAKTWPQKKRLILQSWACKESRVEARRLTREAHKALSVFSNRDAETLHALANYLLEREY